MSTDFNIDSLLDDLDMIVSSTPPRDSEFSTSKHVPHPPYGEKSQSQVSDKKSDFNMIAAGKIVFINLSYLFSILVK